MKVIKTILKLLGIFLGLLVTALLIEANWEVPTGGERAYLDRPTSIAVMTFPENWDSSSIDQCREFWMNHKGIYNSIFTDKSNTLCVTYDPDMYSRNEILILGKLYHPELLERPDINSSPECPVDMVAWMRFQYQLNFRKHLTVNQ